MWTWTYGLFTPTACKLCDDSSEIHKNSNVPLMKNHMKVYNLKTQKLKTAQHVNFVAATVTENSN